MKRAVKVIKLKIQALADLGQTEIALPATMYDMLSSEYLSHAPLKIQRAHGPELEALSMIPSGAGADAADVGGPVLSSSGGDT